MPFGTPAKPQTQRREALDRLLDSVTLAEGGAIVA
jgi:hypothetical protein